MVCGIYGPNDSQVSEQSARIGDDTSKEIVVSDLADFEAEGNESGDYGRNMEEGEGGWDHDELEEIK